MFRVKYCREIILKLLYQIDVLGLHGEKVEDLLENNKNFFKDLTEIDIEFIVKIINQVQLGKESNDKLISRNLIGWKLDRLLPVDRSLIRMGIAESQFNDQKAMIIDDIIRIAKKYGSEESYKIINAILDKVIK
ncbi:MAG: transcription antitermination factor NusB [Candidatus Aminicenantes bacterium]|nr:transcription antitermination factor NusB [Candidatus Aminicenantes bacterium]